MSRTPQDTELQRHAPHFAEPARACADSTVGNATDTGLTRRRASEAVWDPGTMRELRRLGIDRGWRCLEVGAGAGSIAHWLADVVGPTGRVTATDTDTSLLRALDRSNLTVLEHDVATVELPPAEFDLVHARMVLQHVSECDAAVANMVTALKPGGWLVLEDFDWLIRVRAEPPGELSLALDDDLAQMMEQACYDIARGRRNAPALRRAGLKDVGVNGRARVTRSSYAGAESFRARPADLRAALVRAGIDGAFVERALERLELGDTAIVSQTMIAARGRAPWSWS